jgi:hypothetical protein
MGGVVTHRFGVSTFGPDGGAVTPAPPPSTKWRLMSEQDNRVVRISEISMASSPGGSNLCSGGTASTNSGGTAGNALDGNTGTYWESNRSGLAPARHYWQYDFASAVSLAEIKLTTPATANCPLALQVDYWDGARWVNAYMIGGEPSTWTANVARTFTMPAANYAWRITNLFGTAGAFSLAELRMKATAGGSNLCAGGAAISNMDDAQFSTFAKYAFDTTTSNDSLIWSTFTEANQYALGFQFASAVSVVAEIDIVARNNASSAAYLQTPFEYTLERWNGSYWAFAGACNTALVSGANQTRTATVAQADAAKKAWRIRMLTSGSTEFSVRDVEFRAAIGGASVATGGAAFATSYYRGSSFTSTAGGAFDGSSGTFWTSELIASQVYDDICLGYVMPSAQNVVEVAITATAGGPGSAPTSFVVEYWDPATDQWVESWTVGATGSWSAGQTKVFTHP